jgi:hypothetical protein
MVPLDLQTLAHLRFSHQSVDVPLKEQEKEISKESITEKPVSKNDKRAITVERSRSVNARSRKLASGLGYLTFWPFMQSREHGKVDSRDRLTLITRNSVRAESARLEVCRIRLNPVPRLGEDERRNADCYTNGYGYSFHSGEFFINSSISFSSFSTFSSWIFTSAITGKSFYHLVLLFFCYLTWIIQFH